MPPNPHICMLAAENDAIPGAKVGGIGDVIRDIPPALAAVGARVTVLIPAYGSFHTLPGASNLATVNVSFMGEIESIDVVELYQGKTDGVRYIVLHHALFAAGGIGQVYCNDGSDSPFATDASKFALFCAAALKAITDHVFGDVDVLHLHDWHAGYATILRAFEPSFHQLQSIPCIFSIHNLAMQGVRPLKGDTSSLENWFDTLQYDEAMIVDPRWPDCVNPMAAAIRLSDKVHTVSPSYSLEIIQANAPERGFHGGEGLERDLQMCASRSALVGIINGIDYESTLDRKTDWHSLMTIVSDTLLSWLGESTTIRAADYLAHQRTQQWMAHNRPRHIITSVGRLTDQKMALLLMPSENGQLVLDNMLNQLGDKAVFIVLGSGDPELEAQCQRCAARHRNFLYLNRYAQSLADILFANGDLFLMPSSFEPCGISQMLAMRNGQPCLVHAVGGLKDTVEDRIDGYHFSGETLSLQADALLNTLQAVIDIRETDPETYRAVSANAQKKRFLWQASAEQYLRQLYS